VSDASPTGLGLLQDERFVRTHFSPLLSPDGTSALLGSDLVTLHRARAEGRCVAEYRFDGNLRIIAKAYPDPRVGLAVNAIHRALWENGFGAASSFRVPQPIAYLPEYGIMLMHVAPGGSLSEMPLRSWDRFKEGLVEAARWLAALHAWPHRVGPVADVADDFSRLERLETEAAARRPDEAEFFGAASDELVRRYESLSEARTLVQTHGRYHSEHVFLAPGCVTVVDVDRAAVSDAARDVGEFLQRLRWEAARMRLGKAAMNEATEVFLAEYVRHSDSGLPGLVFYWSCSVLSMILRSARKSRPAGRHGNKRLRHLKREFERVPGLIEALFDHSRGHD
jgi:hypothetical protein